MSSLTFNLNANNDIFIGSTGSLSLARDIYAVKVSAESAVKAVFGEMPLAETSGIPYHDVVWVGNPNYVIIESVFRDVLKTVDGVDSVKSFELSQIDDILYYNTTIITDYGDEILLQNQILEA